MYAIWRTLRRPFRYPKCAPNRCVWEVFDVSQAGCLRCGAHHTCHDNAVDSTCPLAVNDDLSRVCTITGCVLNEVRHGPDEYVDTCCISGSADARRHGGATELDAEVHCVVFRLLQGDHARRYRQEENARQARKVRASLHKALRQAKLRGLEGLPNICQVLAEVMQGEKNLRFVQEASERLADQCTKEILACLVELRGRGVKTTSGQCLQELVCGLLYMLRTGLCYRNIVLLQCIHEIADCLPLESKITQYFGISSKCVTSVENLVKLTFRAHYQ